MCNFILALQYQKLNCRLISIFRQSYLFVFVYFLQFPLKI